MSTLSFIFQYIKKHKLMYLGGIIALFIVDFTDLYIPRLTGEVIDGLTEHSLDRAGVFHYVLCILAVGAILSCGRFLWRYFFFGTSRAIERELRDDMFKHLETLGVEYYNENKTGDLMARFSSDLNSVRMAIGPAVIAAFDASVLLVMVLCQMLLYVNVKLTLAAMIPLLFITAGEFYYGKIIQKRFKERQDSISDLTDFVQESFSGARVIKAFVREHAEIRKFAKYNENTKDKNLKVVKVQAVVMPLLDVIIGISSIATLIYGGFLAITGEISLGKFVAFNQYIGMIVWPMLASGDSITLFSKGNASLKRIQEIFNEKPEVDYVVNDGWDKGLEGNIEFNHLSFCHKNADEPVISDINLSVKAGTTLAIIGRTGKGKSTFANLLLHLYNVERGMITFDDIDINDIPTKILRENIAYVPQDNFLFSDTLLANISFGSDIKGTDGDRILAVEDAAKNACIHDNIVEFRDGYNTVVGERGVTLSGGQKQRSAIARAFMKDAPILILDDALSAVDTNTEEKILKNLRNIRAGKTTIIIAHRISTIQNADVIMVLDDGRAVECGNHKELMEQGGIYKEIFEMQQLEAMASKQKEELERGLI